MNVNELGSSDYLKQHDVVPDKLVTIASQEPKDMAPTGKPPEMKIILGFSELDKKLVCNKTNALIIAAIHREDDSENWVGKQVVLYFDPTVSYGGKITGGIRVRASRAGSVPATDAPPATDTTDYSQTNDDIPF